MTRAPPIAVLPRVTAGIPLSAFAGARFSREQRSTPQDRACWYDRVALGRTGSLGGAWRAARGVRRNPALSRTRCLPASIPNNARRDGAGGLSRVGAFIWPRMQAGLQALAPVLPGTTICRCLANSMRSMCCGGRSVGGWTTADGSNGAAAARRGVRRRRSLGGRSQHVRTVLLRGP